MPKTHVIFLTLARLNHIELEQFLSTSMTVMDKANIKLTDHSKIQLICTKLQKELTTYGEYIHQAQPVSSKELLAADKKRGRAVRNLILYFDICRDSPNATKQANATELYELVLPFKTIYKENYEKESASIRSLLMRLEKAPYKEKLNQIGGREFIENVKNSQQDFYQIYTNYTKHKKVEKTRTLTQQRELVTKHYQALYQYLIATVANDEKSPVKPLLLALNDVRKDYKARLNRRKKKEQKVDEPLELPEPTE